MRPFALICLCLAAACSGPTKNDSADDTGEAPTTTVSTPTVDTSVTTGSGSCLERFAPGVTEVDPAGPDTQIHAVSLVADDGLWVAYNLVDSGNYFDVWLVKLACDGSPQVGPLQVTDTPTSELDPVLAWSSDRLLVAWSADDTVGPDNLDIGMRLYDADGQPLSDPFLFEGTRAGTPVTGNATLPAVVGVNEGFLLGGSWGHDDSPAFQAFAVPLDLDGQPLDDAIDGQVDDTYGQLYADVAVDEAGAAHLVWQEDSAVSTAPTVVGGGLGSPGLLADPGARPKLAVGPLGVWLAYDTDLGEVVAQAPDGTQARLTSSDVLHSPSMVGVDDGVVVVAMEAIGGIDNRLRMWRIDTDGDVVAQTTLSTSSAVSVYGTDLTRLDDTHFAVAYQDGSNPDFRAKVEWVELAP
jgi:hypothetical protein